MLKVAHLHCDYLSLRNSIGGLRKKKKDEMGLQYFKPEKYFNPEISGGAILFYRVHWKTRKLR